MILKIVSKSMARLWRVVRNQHQMAEWGEFNYDIWQELL
jgi:hypothetical protein